MMTTKMAGWTAGGVLVLYLATAADPGATPHAPAAPPEARVASPPPEMVPPRAASPSAPAANEQPLHAVESAVRRVRAGGGGEDEVYRLRAEALPARTIAMLTEREQAEQRWMGRIEAWRAERAKLDPADAAALQALRARLFSADEHARLEAYETTDVPRLILP